MGQILTVTFNPVIDKSTTVNALAPEKKLRCTTPRFEPGGGGLNVSRAIKKLGGHSMAFFPLGGHTGKFLQKLVADEGVDCKSIEIQGNTRENLIVLDTANNQQYRFGMPGPRLESAEWQRCLEVIRGEHDVSFLVISGSLPEGVPENGIAEIAAIAKHKGAKLVVDTSGPALQQALREGLYMIKPNLHELSALVGVEEIGAEEVDDVGKTLIKQGSCQLLIVSLGPNGAMAITAEEVVHMVPPVVKRKSTVGAGDSMVAGIVLSLSNGKTIRQALQYGIACGTAATLNEGTELCRLEDVERLYPLVKSTMVV